MSEAMAAEAEAKAEAETEAEAEAETEGSKVWGKTSQPNGHGYQNSHHWGGGGNLSVLITVAWPWCHFPSVAPAFWNCCRFIPSAASK